MMLTEFYFYTFKKMKISWFTDDKHTICAQAQARSLPIPKGAKLVEFRLYSAGKALENPGPLQ